jgi:hypothetical protein
VEFIYVKVPISPELAHREHRVHQALQTALAEASAGSLVGWGASLEVKPPRGRPRVAFHRIDIEVTQTPLGLAVLRAALDAVQVPIGAELHYTQDHVAMQQTRVAGGWGNALPSTASNAPRPR